MAWKHNSLRLIGYLSVLLVVLVLPECQGSDVIAYEGQPSTLQCPTPPDTTANSYQVSWYKQEVTSDDDSLQIENRVAFYQVVLGTVMGDGPIYGGDLMDRAVLDTETADLSINSIQISDEHMYVCSAAGNGDVMLKVYVKPEELTLNAPSSEIVENTTVTFTCIAERVRPEPSAMYFIFTDDPGTQLGVRTTGQIQGEDGVFRDVVALEYEALYTDATRTLQCFLDLGPAGTLTKDYQLSIMYRPYGRPTLRLSEDMVSVDWTVKLTCGISDINSGEAGVTYYIFRRDGDLISNTPNNEIEIDIEGAGSTGNFSCVVGNVYGMSQESQVAVLAFSEVPIPQGASVELIAGVVAGVLVIVIIVIIIICFVRRRNAPKSSGEKSENLFKRSQGNDIIRGSHHSLDAVAGPVYEEVNNGAAARASKPTPAPRSSQKKPKTPSAEPVYAEPQKPSTPANNGSYIYAQPHKNRNPPGRVNNNNTPPTGRHVDSEGKVYVDIDFDDKGDRKSAGPRKPPRTFANAPPHEPVEYAQIQFKKNPPASIGEPGQYANLNPQGNIYANAQ